RAPSRGPRPPGRTMAPRACDWPRPSAEPWHRPARGDAGPPEVLDCLAEPWRRGRAIGPGRLQNRGTVRRAGTRALQRSSTAWPNHGAAGVRLAPAVCRTVAPSGARGRGPSRGSRLPCRTMAPRACDWPRPSAEPWHRPARGDARPPEVLDRLAEPWRRGRAIGPGRLQNRGTVRRAGTRALQRFSTALPNHGAAGVRLAPAVCRTVAPSGARGRAPSRGPRPPARTMAPPPCDWPRPSAEPWHRPARGDAGPPEVLDRLAEPWRRGRAIGPGRLQNRGTVRRAGTRALQRSST